MAKGKKESKAIAADVDSANESSAEEDQEKVVVKKSNFALLMGDEGGDQSDQSEKEEEAEEVKMKEEAESKASKGKQGKKAKKKKKQEDDDEDLEKVLAELELEYSGQKTQAEIPQAEADEGKKKKKKNKKQEEEERADEEEGEGEDEDELGGTVKTAAQKRKEKKERQKQKMAAQKAQEAASSKKKGKAKEEPEGEVAEEAKSEEAKVEEENKDEGEAGEDDKGKKKKKKKGAAEKEDDKKKGKKPNKATIAAMQEALKKVQEEEERRKREEEEKQRLEDEAEEARLEKKRLEEEKRALKKQREKEKKEQLRKEGKLLTAKQKEQQARAQAMLEAMRAQGLNVPEAGEKKRPRPGTRIRPKKEKTPEAEKPEEVKVEEEPVKEAEPETEAKAEDDDDGVADAWDADSDEDVKDSWEMVAEDGEVEDKEKKATKSKDQDEEEEEEESSEEDEESDDDEEEDDEEDSEEEESEDEDQSRRERAMERIEKRKVENEKNRSVDVLRAPVVCVLGHVDTGKTKILDKLRRTNVQDGEAGGITQQIGATNVPIEVIREQCKMVKNFTCEKLPGLLIIDTPGHESFSNLRDRGSSLCDIAILVVDIMHNLEPQTIESINLLKKKKTPFVIALNKIDRLYEWKSNRHKDVSEVIASQQQNTKMEFEKRANEVVVAMAEQGLNAALYYENPDPKTYISMVPTSAHSGDGMGNLMGLLVHLSQNMLAKRLSFSEELQATVLEVKAIPGLGTTIDIVLVNGSLKEGQTLIVAGTEGPIVTPIKALLTPSKMQDLRVKNTYVEHKELRAAQGVKICAKDLDKAIAGLNCLVANHPDEVDILKEETEKRLQSALNAIKLKSEGVFVQASTLGSLEALLEFLRTSKIPYAGVKIGPVVKKDVMRASVMLEHDEKYAVILAFDVRVERDAQELADGAGVKIFQADIIYHLFDRFTTHLEELKRRKREEFKHQAVFPCKLRVMPNFVFNSRDPIVAGVIVEAGIVRQGTPLCVPSKEVRRETMRKIYHTSFLSVFGNRHLHEFGGQPQGGGDGAEGRGGVHQGGADSRRVAQNVRPPFRRDGSARQQGEKDFVPFSLSMSTSSVFRSAARRSTCASSTSGTICRRAIGSSWWS